MGFIFGEEQSQYVILIFLGFTAVIIVVLAIICALLPSILEKILPRKTSKKVRNTMSQIHISYAGSKFELYEEVLMIVACFASFVIWIYLSSQVSDLDTKASEGNFSQAAYNHIFELKWVLWVEFCFALVFIWDFLLNLFLASDSISFLLFRGPLYIITILPSFLGVFIGRFFYGVAILRLWRLYEAINLAVTHEIIKQEFVKELIVLIFTVLCLILTAAGLIFVLENPTITTEGQISNYFISFYFIVVTIATVGYGDFAPKTWAGRTVIILLIIMALVLIPYQATRLLEIVRKKNHPTVKSFKPQKGSGHVILISCSPETIYHFLQEFYHEERKNQHLKVCVLYTGEDIEKEKKAIIGYRERFLSLEVEFLQGEPVARLDLRRAEVKKASAVFLFSPLSITHADRSDAVISLQALSVQKEAREIPLYLQLNRTLTQLPLQEAGVNNLLSIQELKTRLFVLSWNYPGVVPLILNLVRSYAAPPLPSPPSSWDLYVEGLGYEVYLKQFQHNFSGIPFPQACYVIYCLYGILLVGLRNSKREEIELNPGRDRIIVEGDYGIFIAENSDEVKKLKNTSEERIASVSSPFPSLEPPAAFPPSEQRSKHKEDRRERKTEEFVLSSVPDHVLDFVLLLGNLDEVLSFVDSFKDSHPSVPIVLFQEEGPDCRLENFLKSTPETYLIKGHPTSRADIQRSRVSNAKMVYIFPFHSFHKSQMNSDAFSIMAFLLLKNLRPFPLIDLGKKSIQNLIS